MQILYDSRPQHEPDHTDHTDHTQVRSLSAHKCPQQAAVLVHDEVKIGELSDVLLLQVRFRLFLGRVCVLQPRPRDGDINHIILDNVLTQACIIPGTYCH